MTFGPGRSARLRPLPSVTTARIMDFNEAASAAVSGAAADSATIELPVYTPTTTESFASYGVLDGGDVVRQPVTAPKGVVSQFGGLQISTSATALQQLTDAVGYLADYDYDSSDGLAGQIIASAIPAISATLCTAIAMAGSRNRLRALITAIATLAAAMING